jgi:hypothetical protein
MNKPVYSACDAKTRQARAEHQLGRVFYHKKQWKTAARHFGLANGKSHNNDVYKAVYMSYYGLSLLFSGDVSGLNFCRHAAGLETIDADVFLNLALAELKFRHRKRACKAVELGLAVDPRHAGLQKLRRKLGVRRQPCLPFLKRENPLNKWLGKATYRRSNRKGSSR